MQEQEEADLARALAESRRCCPEQRALALKEGSRIAKGAGSLQFNAAAAAAAESRLCQLKSRGRPQKAHRSTSQYKLREDADSGDAISLSDDSDSKKDGDVQVVGGQGGAGQPPRSRRYVSKEKEDLRRALAESKESSPSLRRDKQISLSIQSELQRAVQSDPSASADEINELQMALLESVCSQAGGKNQAGASLGIDAHGLVLDDVQCDEVEVIGEYRSGGNEKTHGAESEDEALVCEGGAQEACGSRQDDEDEPGPAKSLFLTGKHGLGALRQQLALNTANGERKQKQPRLLGLSAPKAETCSQQ